MTARVDAKPFERPTLAVPHRGAAAAVVAVLVAVNVYLLASDHQPVSALCLACASATLWVCAFPLWRFYRSDRATIPYMPVVGLAYATYFAAPIFSTRPLFVESGMPDVGLDAVEYASEIALLGVTAFIVGGYATGPLVRNLGRVRREVDFARAPPLLVLVAGVGLASRMFTLLGGHAGAAAQFFVVGALGGYMALAGLLLAWLRGRARPWHKVAFAGLSATHIGLGLMTGRLAEAILPIVGLVFAYGWERRRIPWALFIAGAVALAPFQFSKMAFRAEMANMSDAAKTDPLARLKIIFDVTYAQTAGEGATIGEIERTTESRTDDLTLLAVVVHDTPRLVPYWNGYTYSDILWHFVPRILAPSKPAPTIGQEFPRRYGIIDYYNYQTSVNLALLIECYANFGPLGVIVGMFIIGLICAALEYSLSASTGGALIGAALFGPLLGVESSFVLNFGGVPYTFLALYVLLRTLPPAAASRSAAI